MANLPKKTASFGLYRVLGNDLPPRHGSGQTIRNLEFALNEEPAFEHCEKRWVVNRIASEEAEQQVIELLERYNQRYIRIPFSLEEYRKAALSSDSEFSKIVYTMNVNGGKNAGLQDARKEGFDWILPFDGNVCFTREAWAKLLEELSGKSLRRCFAVPMYRLMDNQEFFEFDPSSHVEHEPQIVFGGETDAEFDPRLPYGSEDKIRLIKQLGFETKESRRDGVTYAIIVAAERDRAGYALRLFSGNADAEQGWAVRGPLRKQAIKNILATLDERVRQRWG